MLPSYQLYFLYAAQHNLIYFECVCVCVCVLYFFFNVSHLAVPFL